MKSSLNETLIGLEHYLQTNEHVTGGSDNARAVLKNYKKTDPYGHFTYKLVKMEGTALSSATNNFFNTF